MSHGWILWTTTCMHLFSGSGELACGKPSPTPPISSTLLYSHVMDVSIGTSGCGIPPTTAGMCEWMTPRGLQLSCALLLGLASMIVPPVVIAELSKGLLAGSKKAGRERLIMRLFCKMDNDNSACSINCIQCYFIFTSHSS